jgi:hypothetical protein
MRPESIAGHQGSLGSGPELDGLKGPSMKEGGQILDFAVVSLHIGSECRRRPARYQKIACESDGRVATARFGYSTLRLRRRVLVGVSPNNLR